MVTVRDLLRRLPDVSVCAGEGGLDKPIQTVSFIDAPSSVDWLNGGEIILTTAFLYKENVEMQLRFVQKLIEMGVVALGVKIGRYIAEIPDVILTLANEKNFPIFRIGFDTVWSEIFSTFHTLRLDKKNKQSILSTEIVAFDKLFRSSTWDSDAIRAHFLKCISVPSVIVDENYSILCENTGEHTDELHSMEAYCARMQSDRSGAKKPAKFVTHTKQGHRLFDHALYPGERIILYFARGDIQETEVEWISALYKNTREKNRFMQDGVTLWKNFIKECLMGNSEENLVDYIRILNLRKFHLKVILIISGPMALSVSDELKRALRSEVHRNEAMLHCAVMDNGEIIVFYSGKENNDICLFSNELRALLQKALILYSDAKVQVGRIVTAAHEVLSSYQGARMAEQLACKLFPEDNLIFYEDICMIEYLRDNQYDFSAIQYLNQKITSFDACQTLQTFLECGNMKRAAECSFIHDNTMRYRIQKIEQLLHVDLSRPLVRVSLLLKLKLWFLAQEKPKEISDWSLHG